MTKKKVDVKTKGIIFNSIYLIDCDFKTTPNYRRKKLYPPDVNAKYAYEIKKIKDDDYRLICLINFCLKTKKNKAPFSLRVTYQWDYSYSKECEIDIEQFARKIAPAHAITYIREFISNITNRSVYPVFNMPLINIAKLIEKSTTKIALKKRTGTFKVK